MLMGATSGGMFGAAITASDAGHGTMGGLLFTGGCIAFAVMAGLLHELIDIIKQ
jgi:hypothetical protein